MKLGIILNRDELSVLGIQVIIENWDKCSARYGSGSKRRKYQAEFSDRERRVLASFHATFWKWTQVVGFPNDYMFRKMETIYLIRRAAVFFAGV